MKLLKLEITYYKNISLNIKNTNIILEKILIIDLDNINRDNYYAINYDFQFVYESYFSILYR